MRASFFRMDLPKPNRPEPDPDGRPPLPLPEGIKDDKLPRPPLVPEPNPLLPPEGTRDDTEPKPPEVPVGMEEPEPYSPGGDPAPLLAVGAATSEMVSLGEAGEASDPAPSSQSSA